MPDIYKHSVLLCRAFATTLLLALALTSFAQHKKPTAIKDTLLANFKTPPNSAKPRVWWHWMNGNITKDGIEKDLKWMKRAGIGGFHNFDAALGTPQIVKERLVYMTPQWKDAFKFTTKLADSLHLEMAIAGSPGWSESGGPWVPANDGMKKLVWSETRVESGKQYSGYLPKPPTTTGPFQNLPVSRGLGASGSRPAPPVFYQDVAVVAYKLPEADIPLSELKPKVTSSGGSFTLTQLTDGDLEKTSQLPPDSVKGYAWIQFEFEKPQTIKALTIVGGGDKGPFHLNGELQDNRALEFSNDGVNFTRLCYIPAGNMVEKTMSIPVTTAKFFRVTIKNPPPPMNFGAMFGVNAPKPPAGTAIAEIVLHSASRINTFEEKAGFATDIDNGINPKAASNDATALADVINLSGTLTPSGRLVWTPPAGTWNIVRFGYSLMGATNSPASAEATGLEVDKLDPVAVKAYFENYLDQYKSATDSLMGNKGGLQYMITDSWEAGPQNWTGNMPAEFLKRRGYNAVLWLPVLTGHIVGSIEESEKFLWDFRKTLGEMLSEYHYDQLTTLLHSRGMKRYSESHESRREFIGDGMEVKRKADIPMSAFWTPGNRGDESTGYQADVRESASVAHLYGQNLVAAESLTARSDAWGFSPERLKPTADMELASGLNRFVIHTSVHQPTDDKLPGLGLGPFGQWFNRHETWAEQASAWTGYLARSSYMLQQGKFVADVLYYYGEDNNITNLFRFKLPNVPAGYSYDFVNADALLNLLFVSKGQIVTPSGMHYKLLALDPNSRAMTLVVLKKINALVKAGATIIGPAPTGSPSLTDDKTEYKRIANSLWGSGVKISGKGKSITGKSIAAGLTALKVLPDAEFSNTGPNSQLVYVHRKIADGDIYWIDNQGDGTENVGAAFRVSVSGKSAEIWYPETGRTEPIPFIFVNDRPTVLLQLRAKDAVFVVFRKTANITNRTVRKPTEKQLATVDSAWSLSFQKDRGAPEEVKMARLSNWAESTDTGIKYFSGTGTYTNHINAPATWFAKGSKIWIDLGDVKNIAEVFANGKPLGIVWRKPFRVDATSVLKPGENTLTIKVTNLWVNRLIGDKQPGVSPATYTTMPFYQQNSPLLPSGLLGPVRLVLVSGGE